MRRSRRGGPGDYAARMARAEQLLEIAPAVAHDPLGCPRRAPAPVAAGRRAAPPGPRPTGTGRCSTASRAVAEIVAELPLVIAAVRPAVTAPLGEAADTWPDGPSEVAACVETWLDDLAWSRPDSGSGSMPPPARSWSGGAGGHSRRATGAVRPARLRRAAPGVGDRRGERRVHGRLPPLAGVRPLRDGGGSRPGQVRRLRRGRPSAIESFRAEEPAVRPGRHLRDLPGYIKTFDLREAGRRRRRPSRRRRRHPHPRRLGAGAGLLAPHPGRWRACRARSISPRSSAASMRAGSMPATMAGRACAVHDPTGCSDTSCRCCPSPTDFATVATTCCSRRRHRSVPRSPPPVTPAGRRAVTG